MNGVSLIPLGVGEALAARYYTSSIALGIDGDWFLIDCPRPVRKMLREASIDAGLPDPLDLNRILPSESRPAAACWATAPTLPTTRP